MVVWVSHARVGHRQGFIPEAPSKRWGLLLLPDTPCPTPAPGHTPTPAASYPGAGWSSLAARRAHNPKVAGSNPAPATNAPTQTATPRVAVLRWGDWGFVIRKSDRGVPESRSEQ